MLVDSHCHLDFPDFAGELETVLERARGVGVGAMVTIGTKLAQFPAVRAIADGHDRVYCSVGIHPHEAETEIADGAVLAALTDHPRVVGVGESGLDYFYERAPRERQKANFRAHIQAAKVSRLPLIVHSRDAEDDTIAELRAAGDGLKGVLHCFSASRQMAEQAIDLGFYVSLSGIVTFKNATDLRETVKTLPLDRILVETDSPYLAPAPLRGRRNEPAFVVHTAAVVARLKGVSDQEFAARTTSNFLTLFDKVRPTWDAAA